MQVTFMSGDVHVAGLGRFCTRPVTNLRTDHRFMPQVRGGGTRGLAGEGSGGGGGEGPGLCAQSSAVLGDMVGQSRGRRSSWAWSYSPSC